MNFTVFNFVFLILHSNTLIWKVRSPTPWFEKLVSTAVNIVRVLWNVVKKKLTESVVEKHTTDDLEIIFFLREHAPYP